MQHLHDGVHRHEARLLHHGAHGARQRRERRRELLAHHGRLGRVEKRVAANAHPDDRPRGAQACSAARLAAREAEACRAAQQFQEGRRRVAQLAGCARDALLFRNCRHVSRQRAQRRARRSAENVRSMLAVPCVPSDIHSWPRCIAARRRLLARASQLPRRPCSVTHPRQQRPPQRRRHRGGCTSRRAGRPAVLQHEPGGSARGHC
jgi:hypothetical protein